jgi:ubiquinone/menaquinone biosynthesis C-methylase UbiE
MTDSDYENVAGNYYDKFSASNPLVKWMMHGFKTSLLSLTEQISYHTMLELGCGEGYIQELLTPDQSLASDIDLPIVRDAKIRYPHAGYVVADGTQMPLTAASFDLVVAVEVLEHVPQPVRLLQEAKRLSRRYCIFSVPREPMWRVLNMMRGRYWGDWGNTPGHINHWSSHAFSQFLGKEFRVLDVQQPVPWTMILCEVAS